jgi:asparagine synthase (glutamine-hydrolysing)
MPVDPDALAAMRDALRHRGPDDVGQFLRGNVGLGFRRLAIIDLVTGNQPIANEDGTVVVVFNGEIYNYRPLRNELLRNGHQFTTDGDSEVIVHLYEERGEAFVEALNGMFGIAIWDSVRKKLVLARDRTGEKPLYYTEQGSDFYFASEMKAFLKIPGLSLAMREDVLPEFLSFGTVYGPDTLLRGVHEVPPGHIAVIEDGKLAVRRYWDVQYVADLTQSEAQYEEQLESLLAESVAMRLMSDVPLGAFLSGGIDSSLTVALMSRVMRDPVKTFCVGFDIPGYSELEYARRVARLMNTDHHEMSVTREAFFGALPRLIYHQDEPINHSSAIPLHFLAAYAKREGVTVLVSGEGGDELFAGYSSYAALLRDVRLRAFMPPFVWRTGSSLLRAIGMRKYGNIFERYSQPLERLIWGTQTLLSQKELFRLVGDASGSGSYFLDLVRSGGDTPLQRILYAHLKTRLVSLLMKQDKMTMGASVEVRVPFLDHRIVSLAASMQDNLKIRRGEQKYILRKVAARVLPPDIIGRTKAGFPVPLAKWFREGDKSMDILFEKRTMERGLFEQGYVRDITQAHRQGSYNFSATIWNLINLEHWIRIFIEGEQVDLSSHEETLPRARIPSAVTA